MLEAINLSLSSACGADCLFCPTDRGKRIKQKIMPFDIVKRIIDEISSKEFKSYHCIKKIELGENGDAFLNREFIKILRYIRLKVPEVRMEIYNNFQHFTRQQAEIILKDRLIDSFHLNIDGSNAKNYYEVKRLDFPNTMKNLSDFLEIREKLDIDSPLTVHILTLHHFISSIYDQFGFLPGKVEDPALAEVPDDFAVIKKQVEQMLNMKKDTIVKPPVFAWSEREQIDTSQLDYERYSCPLLSRVETQAFIAPNGDWYACCYDSNYQLVLGNVTEQSINEIYYSEKRKNLLRLLKEKQFTVIGGPCLTVNCCQPIGAAESWTGRRSFLSRLKRKLKKLRLIKLK
jgi:radical SAM protein with 4Fe4S-binding SPASM domain